VLAELGQFPTDIGLAQAKLISGNSYSVRLKERTEYRQRSEV
jgi:hypothetical protein